MKMPIIEAYLDDLIKNSTLDVPAWNIEAARKGGKSGWNYIDGCMILAMIETWKITGEKKYLDFAEAYIDHRVQEDGTITEAQKAEIENLKYQNALLDEKIEKLKEANNEEVKTQARDSEKAFNKQFGNGFDVGSNASDVISSVSKNFNGDGTANGVSWNMATSGNDKDTAVAQLVKIKLATDAYNDAVKELNNATDEDQKVLACLLYTSPSPRDS